MASTELLAVSGAVISFLVSIVVGLLAWSGRSTVADLRDQGKALHEHSTRLAVLEQSTLKQRVDEHAERITSVERGMGEVREELAGLRGDTRVIRELVELLASKDRR